MIDTVLIANRGEIAVRIIRACRQLGLKTAAVFSEADRESMHAGMADKAVCIGPAPARESYLDVEAILSAARVTGAQAVHPGYGFLAENAGFAEACAARGLAFIGPPAEAIRRLGFKPAARELAAKAGVPVVPGASGGDLAAGAAAIGFPVMVKASAGGGGKGMRVVREPGALSRELELASREAQAAFGDGSVYIEKLIERPRHVEIQIIADSRGNIAAFPERDCSVQRRHQKLIEESPSPAVDEGLRRRMQEAASSLARAAGYVNAGTVEFLLDAAGRFYFMEVNTRLQVEHPVTETVTGLDLAVEQLRVAMGESLGLDRARASAPDGHCFEFRINAEDPARGFAPCPGLVTGLRLPGGPGVRVDTHLVAGYTVPSYYDSLVAKLIVGGPDRASALARARGALRELKVEGISTTIPFHLAVASHPGFAAGDVDTSFVERMAAPPPGREAAPAGAAP